ncbi:MAG: glycosyltransferase [Clostridia bacterium]|nr:glycosyltransferase [Clostridia bacterium]
MITVSLCMIVKNEEEHLPHCLRSVQSLVDEIIIVDTGSTDNTKEIAAAFGAKIYDFVWCDDFSAARNFSFSKATQEYCMWLDADDVFSDGDRNAFLRMKGELPDDTDVVMLRYHTAFDATGRPTFSYWRERLLRRSRGFRFEGAVHEAITPCGKIYYGDAAVSHRKTKPGDPDRNLLIYEKLRESGKAFSPREQFYYARELMYHARYGESAAVFSAFLDEGRGWIENNLEACRNLAFCRKQTGDTEGEFAALTRALRYAPPRAELCCDLGHFFFEKGDLTNAVFWYEAALKDTAEDTGGGFSLPDCRGVIPLLQLCVCYYRLGDRDRAEKYNEAVGKLNPNHASYLYNKAFFSAPAP